MAALVAPTGLDLLRFREHLAKRLPEYARPVFLRVLPEIETTGTFKPKKQELARIGFDPRAITDSIFVNDRDAGAFVPLDATLFERIRGGQFRL